MGLWRKLLLFVLLLPVAFLVPTGQPLARSGQAYIDAVQLRRGAKADLVIGFRVQGALDRPILDTLDSGLPVRFTYWIRVERPRDLLRDDLVTEVRIDRSLVKDNLKDRFRVTLEGRGEPRDLPALPEAVEAMTKVEGVSVLPLETLSRQAPLILKIKAKLQKFQLPFRLHYLLAFVSYWDVETEWYVLELPRGVEAIP